VTAKGEELLRQLGAKFDQLAHAIAVRNGVSEPAPKRASRRDDERGRGAKR
jgi:hypothetical protein